jgi:hypothetical protein
MALIYDAAYTTILFLMMIEPYIFVSAGLPHFFHGIVMVLKHACCVVLFAFCSLGLPLYSVRFTAIKLISVLIKQC